MPHTGDTEPIFTSKASVLHGARDLRLVKLQWIAAQNISELKCDQNRKCDQSIYQDLPNFRSRLDRRAFVAQTYIITTITEMATLL